VVLGLVPDIGSPPFTSVRDVASDGKQDVIVRVTPLGHPSEVLVKIADPLPALTDV
jgi:hypothetical protein